MQRRDSLICSRMIRPRVFLISVAVLAARPVFAPAQRPPIPAASQIDATINGERIQLDFYYSPECMQEDFCSLVPFGELWGTGAKSRPGSPRRSIFESEISNCRKARTASGLSRRKGWTLVLNKQHGQFHLDYDQSETLVARK